MATHADILDRPEPLTVPFWTSLVLHVAILGGLGVGAFVENHSRIVMGSPHGGGMGSVMVSPVSSIPLPNRGGPTNPVANQTESQVPTPPTPKEKAKPAPKVKAPPPNAVQLKSDSAPKRRSEPPTQPTNTFRDQKQYDPSQLYTSGGQRMSTPSFAIQGAGGPTLGDNSPFGQQFGAYAKLLQDNIARNWHPTDASRAFPAAVVTFTIQRDGSVANVKIGRSSGNSTLDNSALRAVMDAHLPALPLQFPKNQADVELKFELGK